MFPGLASTLTSLEFDLQAGEAIAALVSAAPHLPHLASLSVTFSHYSERDLQNGTDTAAPAIAQLASRLPALRHLDLSTSSPRGLSYVLALLAPPTSLRQLRTLVRLPQDVDGFDKCPAAEQAAAMEQWVGLAEACARSRLVGQLERWRFGVWPEFHVDRKAAPFEEQVGAFADSAEAWKKMQAEVAERGVEFMVEARHP